MKDKLATPVFVFIVILFVGASIILHNDLVEQSYEKGFYHGQVDLVKFCAEYTEYSVSFDRYSYKMTCDLLPLNKKEYPY